MSVSCMKWLRVVGVGSLTSLLVCTGCNLPSKESASTSRATAVVVPSMVAEAPTSPKPVAATAAAVGVAALIGASLQAPKAATEHAGESSLKVKRLVVATGVKDREPLISDDALPSDGSAIYAFAELANPAAGSENVRITFERKGGAERVGDVTLPVPGNVLRHRTWAFTRFIRAPGVWEAVLWSESGAELGRTSFEVKAS